MLGVALIVFREVLEAALIIGIIFAATQGVTNRGRWIVAGIGTGVIGAVIVAMFADRLATAAAGMGQELFNATVLFAAVAMLGWHTLWMARHGREMTQVSRRLGANVAVGAQPLYAVAIVVGLAVLREGSEVVLFLYGLVASGSANADSLLFGGQAGLAAGIAVGVAIARGLLSIPSRHLFTVTGWLIALLAAGMSAQGVAFLNQAGYVSHLTEIAWNSSAFAADGSMLGQALHALIGYTAAPMQIQVIAYVVTLVVLGAAMIIGGTPKFRVATAAPGFAAALCAAIAVGTCGLREAHAGPPKVYSPYVELGEWEFEFRSATTFDNDDDKDGAQSYVYEIGYSPTAFWHTALFLGQGAEPGDFLRSNEFVWENIFQLTEPGQYWLDVGAYVEYAKGLRQGGDHALEWKVLLEKPIGKWTFIANPIFVQDFPEADEDPGVQFEYAWGTYYRLMSEFEPGFEAFGGVGELTHANALEEQEHLLGPSVRGRLPMGGAGKLAYNLGYLFGLTDQSPDGTFKVELEYELRF